MHKRTLLFIILFIMFVLCGCNSVTEDLHENNDEQINIRFSFWEPGMYRELENALQMITEQYEKEHPNISIELISKPVDSYFDWIKTCYIADDMPEIESAHSTTLASQYKKGMIVDISNAFNAESAYSPGKSWKDTFIEDKFCSVNNDYQDSNCVIPLFGTELGFFYNKTIYKELGLKEPETWKEFIDNCEAIKNADKIPIIIPGKKSSSKAWLTWEIGQGLSMRRFLEDKNININNDNFLSDYEKNRAVLLGYIDVTTDKTIQKLYKSIMEHYEEYLQYCEGTLDLEESIAKAMFISGNIAHINSGAWDAKSFLDNPDVKFEVGTFKFPIFTNNDTDYPGKRIFSNTSQCLGITTSVYKQEGKLEATIDFLQYLTSKDIYQQFVDYTMEIPTVKDVKTPKLLENFGGDGYLVGSEIFAGLNIDVVAKGTKPELNDVFFAEIHNEEIEAAKNYMDEHGLSEKNNYYFKEKTTCGAFSDKGEGK